MIYVSIRASTSNSKNYISRDKICRLTAPCRQHIIPLHPNTMNSFSKSDKLQFASDSALPAIPLDSFNFIT